MTAITTFLAPSFGREHVFQARDGTSSRSFNQVQAETHTSADIAFVTAEGDKVTLSTDAVAQATYSSYDAHGRRRGHDIDRHAETFQLTSAKNVSLHIEGDLNDAERADIQQALGIIEKLTTDFFHGNLDESLNQAFDLGNLKTLSTIDATVERSQSLTVRQQTATRASADKAAALPTDAAALGAKPGTTQSPKPLLAALLHADETPTVAPAIPADKATRFFEKLSEKLAERFDFGASQHQTLKQIAAQFLQQLSQDGSIETPATATNSRVVQPEEPDKTPA